MTIAGNSYNNKEENILKHQLQNIYTEKRLTLNMDRKFADLDLIIKF